MINYKKKLDSLTISYYKAELDSLLKDMPDPKSEKEFNSLLDIIDEHYENTKDKEDLVKHYKKEYDKIKSNKQILKT